MLKVLAAAAIFVAVMYLGTRVLGMLGRAQPSPPPPGELRRVNLRYRCPICGTEVRMTAAPDEEPEPPRHCLEDMELVAPVWE